MQTMFDIFKCQLPIELHENALYTIINVISDLTKPLKESILTQGLANQLFSFLEDLHYLEFNILRGA